MPYYTIAIYRHYIVAIYRHYIVAIYRHYIVAIHRHITIVATYKPILAKVSDSEDMYISS